MRAYCVYSNTLTLKLEICMYAVLCQVEVPRLPPWIGAVFGQGALPVQLCCSPCPHLALSVQSGCMHGLRGDHGIGTTPSRAGRVLPQTSHTERMMAPEPGALVCVGRVSPEIATHTLQGCSCCQLSEM